MFKENHKKENSVIFFIKNMLVIGLFLSGGASAAKGLSDDLDKENGSNLSVPSSVTESRRPEDTEERTQNGEVQTLGLISLPRVLIAETVSFFVEQAPDTSEIKIKRFSLLKDLHNLGQINEEWRLETQKKVRAYLANTPLEDDPLYRRSLQRFLHPPYVIFKKSPIMSQDVL